MFKKIRRFFSRLRLKLRGVDPDELRRLVEVQKLLETMERTSSYV